ncbi:RHS repeat-associated core domain-containing protein [Winogradskya humida]|uniref:RHS repeat-associated core domain-containing protein n=3 Tax=Winogradskya humida TaxID=113566 RepID=UPI0031E1293D
MARPADWDILDLDGDPTPGDPARVRQLASRFHDFAETAHRAKVAVDSLQGDGAVLTWVGLSGDAFREQFGDFPNQVNKLYQSHLMVGDALETYAPTLETAQAQADRALADGRVAAEKLKSLQGALSTAQTDFTGASQAAEKAQAETQAPDPDQVKQAVKDADAAKAKVSGAQSAVNGAQQELDLAKQLAEQARQMRDGAAQVCKREIEDASDAGIQPRSFWQKLGDALKELWNIICEVAKWVALVAGIIGMILGGPLAWIALAAGAILLVKAIVDFAQGKGSVLDLVMGILGIIPGVKGLTSLSKLSALYKAGGLKEIAKAALTGMKDMAKGMLGALKGLGSGLSTITKGLGDTLKGGVGKIGDLLRNLGNRPPDIKFTATELKIRDCVTDPVDVATGEVVLTDNDLGLLERTHVSSYRAGRWFGPLWTSVLDQRLELDDEGSCYFAPDGMILAYPQAEPGEQVLPLDGPRRPLTWYSDGGAEMHDPETGATLLFRPAGPVSALTAVIGPAGRTEITWEGETPVRIAFPGGESFDITVTDGLVTAVGDVAYGYDDDRRLTEVVTERGPERFEYTDDRIAAWHDWSGTYRYEYDDRGRCVQTVSSNGYLDGRIAYDDEQRTTTFTDALGHTTVYHISPQLRTSSRVDPLGRVTAYDWDNWGRLLSTTDPLGNAAEQETPADHDLIYAWIDPERGEIEYGPFSTVAAWTDPAGARTEFGYDAELQLTSVTDPRGLVWRYAYDAAGQLIAEVDFDGRQRRYEYDAAGRVIRLVDTDGAITEFGYDAWSRLTERRTATDTATFRYDEAGLLLEARNNDTELVLSRDERGRLVRQSTNGSALTFEYDDMMMTRHRRTPSAVASSWQWEMILGHAAWLTVGGHELTLDHQEDGREVRRSVGGDVVLEQIFDDEDRLAMQRIIGDRLRTFGYRADGKPESVTDGSGITSLELDPAGRVLAVRGAGRDEFYRFGPAGNLAAAGDREFRYEGTLLRQAGDIGYEYDTRGRAVTRTVDDRTWRFAWNDLNQIAWVLTPGGDQWRYLYDPLLRRVAKQRVEPATSRVLEQTEFVWNGAALVEEIHTGADGVVRVTTWEHHPDDDYCVAQVRDDVLGVVVTDAVGTPTDLVVAGKAVPAGDFDLWGRQRGPHQPATPLRFPGQYFDAETGLHYNVHRYYDPATARYLSPDPLGLVPAPDPAAYVGNPIADFDPLGLMPACNLAKDLKFENLSFEKQFDKITDGAMGNTVLKNLVFRKVPDGDPTKGITMGGFKFPSPAKFDTNSQLFKWGNGKTNLISEHRVVDVKNLNIGATDNIAVHLNVMVKQTGFDMISNTEGIAKFHISDFHLTARPLKEQLTITKNQTSSSIFGDNSVHWNTDIAKPAGSGDRFTNLSNLADKLDISPVQVNDALGNVALRPMDAIDTLQQFQKDFAAKIINGLNGENIKVEFTFDSTADVDAALAQLKK